MQSGGTRLRRVARVAGGTGLLVAGAVLLVLPGPGLPLLLGALVLLETEFHWARRLRARLSEAAARPAWPLRRGARWLLGHDAQQPRVDTAPQPPSTPSRARPSGSGSPA